MHPCFKNRINFLKHPSDRKLVNGSVHNNAFAHLQNPNLTSVGGSPCGLSSKEMLPHFHETHQIYSLQAHFVLTLKKSCTYHILVTNILCFYWTHIIGSDLQSMSLIAVLVRQVMEIAHDIDFKRTCCLFFRGYDWIQTANLTSSEAEHGFL